jgi:hypothetical protein
MSGEEAGSLRIGHAEREKAMTVLSDQFALGRLSPEEFLDRSAAVSVALTQADLRPIFADLPIDLPAAVASATNAAAGYAGRLAQETARMQRAREQANRFGRLKTATRFGMRGTAVMTVLSSAYYLMSSVQRGDAGGYWLILTGYGWIAVTCVLALACVVSARTESHFRDKS